MGPPRWKRPLRWCPTQGFANEEMEFGRMNLIGTYSWLAAMVRTELRPLLLACHPALFISGCCFASHHSVAMGFAFVSNLSHTITIKEAYEADSHGIA
jgi:hypothetical protein